MSLSLTNICPIESKLHTAAVCVAKNLSLRFGGKDQKVTFHIDKEPIESPELVLSLLVDGKPVAVRFNRPPFSPEVFEEHGVVSFTDLPRPIQKSMVERLFDDDLSKLEQWLGRNIEFGDKEPAKKLTQRVYFTLGGEIGVAGEIAMTGESVSLLAKILDCLPRQRADIEEIPISLGIEIGRTSLEVQSVRELESGDLIVIEEGPDLKNSEVFVRPAHSTIYRGRLRGAEVKIESYMSVDTENVVEYDNAFEAETGNLPAKRDGLTSIDDIPVSVVFELGRRQITVSDLDQIQPGAVIELENPVEQARIVVRVNGKAIATGSLAEVGEKLAVRID